MLFLTIINALPVKQRMKNAFLENHIFTEYNLVIFNGGGVKALEENSHRPLLVPGHIQPVNVGVRTQPPELEVHLPGVLTSTGEDI